MTTAISSGAWLEQTRRQLGSAHEQAGLETQLLLSHVLSKPRGWLLAHPDFELGLDQIERLQFLLERLADGEPLPYLIGHWEFYGIDFVVGPEVLIPRPETELLVEQALQRVQSSPRALRAVDIGTGSGCIAISLARHCAAMRILAIDISQAALRIARQNVVRQVVQNQVSLLQADLLSASAGPFDLLCANLPYIPSATLAGLEVARHEPTLALDGGRDGLRLVERLLAQAATRMAPSSMLLLEIESGQSEGALELARRYIPAANSAIVNDLAGNPRLLRIETDQCNSGITSRHNPD
jgi:release factor glutamine methyltransferase